jgi:hypothetical protein
MDVMPAGGAVDVMGAMDVMGVMVVAVAMDATAADVIRCRQVSAKDVRVNVERVVMVPRLTARRGTA